MWRLKLKFLADNQTIGSVAKKHQVSLTGYPLSYWKDDKYLYLIGAGYLFGDEENKKSLLEDIKNRPEFIEVENQGDFFIITVRQLLLSEPAYNPKIIRPNPIIITKDGHHFWDLASFDRKTLEDLMFFAEKHLNAKILSFKEEKIRNIYFTKLLPDLTNNQKKAMELAINAGYYEYPKKITLPELAKDMNISYSTYQAHLKKAEGKIFPLVLKDV